MSQFSDKLFDKWINGRFDSKMVVSVTQKDQFKNLGFSVINGRSYSTKLGPAMSLQLGPNDLQELIDVLQDVQSQYFPPASKNPE
ncbi:hypothetical protein CEE45_17890 [Candidatus Heimdallarchaeota archaeon B3_Heim]|nr:MAG: hypothetical protein CEE45_17890 [Candidatus Heimdallarchaeota archaeon B3_Heim]